MARKIIQVVGSDLDNDDEVAPLLAGRYSNQFAIFLCDTEADLPAAAFGRFAIVKEPDEGPHGPRWYFYVGTDNGWRRCETEPIDD